MIPTVRSLLPAFGLWFCASICLVTPAWPDPAVTSDPDDAVVASSPGARRGQRFARLHCARCHAIDRTSDSPLANAPPFRTLHLRYKVEDLLRPLAEGIHPTMPLFRLEAGQLDDLMTFLKALETN
jgi:cytochrome c